MNQHLPPSNLREVAAVAPLKSAEQFLMLAGKREPWVFGDLMDRATVIEEVGANYTSLAKIIAFSLEAGTCRDATDEIASIVIERWAQDDVELSRKQRDWVAMCKGEAFANSFRVEAA
ncbi:hypothetical protein IVB27_32320 [Bradyrhizobium sp. 197]|uniref:hypothetical protein n=1 Tax=Bradyrhizobium sp. 197 TaxID=2782663 RepID=UPI001FF99F9D|nr:hypothetical protein [Bradyrhizobium sp. 197]MCK1479300.1 hypothetical protein [Bradyrhizobium sp. 197]